jgi:hypothetical protein
VLWDALLGIIFIGAIRYGDYVTNECPQAGYACPKICDVDHKHLPLKECKDAKGKRNIWKEGWKTAPEKETEKEKIEEFRNAKDKKSGRSKKPLQVSKQLDQEAVGIHKSKGL